MRAVILCALLLACAGPPPRSADLPLRDPGDCGLEIDPIEGVDVAVSIDTSRSTDRPSGRDLDGDGMVGTPLDAGTSDPHDSLLAAQVMGVRALVHALAGSDVRFSIVSMSGRSHDPEGTRPLGRVVRWEQAKIRAPMTDDPAVIERALDAILATGGEGRTDFAAAMNLAIRTLEKAPPGATPRRRLALFLSDSASPMVSAPLRVPYYLTDGAVDRLDPLMKQEALRALREGVRFHAIALGHAAEDAPPHPLIRIAGATGGAFRTVADPERVHCALLAEVAKASSIALSSL